MIRPLLLALACTLAVAGCAPSYQTVQLVNRTNRVIEQIYIYPSGAAEHGASRGSLAPDATTAVKIRSGNVEVLAISHKVRIDDTTSETRTATQTLELTAPLQLVFHDSTQTPSELARPGTLGVTFEIIAPPPPPASDDQVEAR